jgi:hypothetical protein
MNEVLKEGKMKKLSVLVMIVGIGFFAACGDGGGSNPEQAAQNSYNAMVSIIDFCLGGLNLEANADGYLVSKQAAQTCDCPGGGTLSVDANVETITADGCKASNGLEFDGSVTINDQGLVNGTMSPFGDCSTVTATNVGTDTCEGTVSGTCDGDTATCTVTDGSGDECDVNC